MQDTIIDFYKLEENPLNSNYMLFPKFDNMPVVTYFGSKKKMTELKKELNEILNMEYLKANKPTLIVKK